ncbi:dual specificity phosphatase [Aspergillus pseudoustus]|uniref:protein-tyrosine-phosphatase n=1 Tax=Aspergillus pseudoustus TaxID=1810923 RepID=A0ABR4KB55_9EURO
MPVQTSPPSLPDSFPSFMSVFGGESHISLEKEEQRPQIQPLRLPTNVTVNTSRRPLPFQHRESVSSVTSGSADSSPTTTVSTFDSPITSDTSPGSSPESPTSMPLSYSKFMAAPRTFENQALSAAQSNLSKMTSDLPQRRPDSPGRRDRNLKNLSLRMPPPLSSSRPSIATASVVETNSQHHLSAPPSPINMPPKGIRRKPAGLTIRTPGFDRSFSGNIPELVPPTPHGRLSLRHTESSPSLTSVFSPSFGPKGGMSLPRPSTQHGYRRPSAPSEDNLSPVPSITGEEPASEGVLHELAEEDDPPLDSRESAQRSERGYPNGPIQIYDSGVFLYLEPTMEEASRFDVVINVAKEVTNPFKKTDGSQTVMSTWRNGAENLKRQSCSTPFTAFSDTSFKSAFEYLPSDESSPATPRNEPSGPEYVHVGWDHNSEILDDLYPLCELIDSRISQGKRILVHCQLGASRSASLVIAYGLFKNRTLDFNSMYETVKERSRWVSPNMSLIYQLTDFRSRLVRGSRPSSGDWSFRGSAPQTPLSGRVGSQPDLLGPATGSPDTSLLSAKAFSQSSFSSNSLSVPSTDRTTPVSAKSLGFPKSLSKKRSVSPRPLALRQSFFNPESTKAESSSAVGPSNGGKGDSSAVDSFKEPGLFSPRTTGFMAPRPRPLSGILENGHPNGLTLPIADPRSPPQGQERMIMRNIDEFL